tara:strand:- start:334 stop:780 length:447 start_codon:yes stop_codon:yes gene_type:complete
MAHYAILDENDIVVNVTTGRDETDTIDGVEQNWEANYAEQFSVPTEQCKRTSYNTGHGKYYKDDGTLHDDQSKAFRANFAGVGQKYDRENNVFYAANPGGASWVLNTDGYYYEPPVAYPTDGHKYNWHEEVTNWVKAADASELDIEHP